MNHDLLMEKALGLAQKGAGRVSPNPLVGAVVYKKGTVLSCGYHGAYGQAHAEREALLKISPRAAKGAVLYVNLEPCAHYGKTPPCTDLIIKYGIKKVVVAMEDPHSLVGGKGIRKLREKGVDVLVGIQEKKARFLNRGYISHHERKRPWFILKGAASLDGKISSAYGESRWISGPESRLLTHEMRYVSDAVLAGKRTILGDNPRLLPYLLRKKHHPLKRPARIVLDTHLELPSGLRIFDTQLQDTFVFYHSAAKKKKESLEKKGVRLVRISRLRKGSITLREVADSLYREKIMTVLVEGGAEIFSSFFEEGLADELYFFYHPFILGGKKNPSLCAGKGFHLDRAYPVRIWDLKRWGEDFLFHGICSQV